VQPVEVAPVGSSGPSRPLVCPRGSSKMRILAAISDPGEVKKILRHLVKIGRPPPGVDPAALN
jgi:hypothetical protein